MKFATVLLVLLLVTASLGGAQAPEAVPVLSEENRLKIQVIELQAENLHLKMQQAAAELAKLEADTKPFFASLAVEGYRLERGPAGWVYQPVKPAP